MNDKKSLTVREFLTQPQIFGRFAEILGDREAAGYIASVGLAVANSRKLQECDNMSIFVSAMRAATLRLSVDPSTGQAYIVPYKGRATFIPGYKGYLHMAVRTNKYRYVNVGNIYEGMTVEEDPITGYLKIGGGAISRKIIGYVAAFELLSGYGKAIYMTIEEIHAHAKTYSPSYNLPDSAWKTNTEAMERKTVLRRLLTQWGYLDPADKANLNKFEEEAQDEQDEQDRIFNAEYSPVLEDATQGNRMAEEPVGKSEEDILRDLGF